MTRTTDIFVLFNPAAGRGNGARRVDTYLEMFRRHMGAVDHGVSSHPGNENELVDRALDAGYRGIVAVGGDGTWSAVANRVLHSGRHDVAVGLLPAGTGNDFGKSLGIRVESAEAVVRAICEGRTRAIDVGRVGDRHFLNVVGMGFDIAVIDDAARIPFLRGDALYRFSAIRQLFRFPGLKLTLSGGGEVRERAFLMLVIANGNYFGGSFHVAPDASLDDGRLDAVAIYNAGPLTRAQLFSLVSKGRHRGNDRVDILTHDAFVVDYEGPSIRYEVDGEVFAWSDGPLRVASVPRALTVYAPPDPALHRAPDAPASPVP